MKRAQFLGAGSVMGAAVALVSASATSVPIVRGVPLRITNWTPLPNSAVLVRRYFAFDAFRHGNPHLACAKMAFFSDWTRMTESERERYTRAADARAVRQMQDYDESREQWGNAYRFRDGDVLPTMFD